MIFSKLFILTTCWKIPLEIENSVRLFWCMYFSEKNSYGESSNEPKRNDCGHAASTLFKCSACGIWLCDECSLISNNLVPCMCESNALNNIEHVWVLPHHSKARSNAQLELNVDAEASVKYLFSYVQKRQRWFVFDLFFPFEIGIVIQFLHCYKRIVIFMLSLKLLYLLDL